MSRWNRRGPAYIPIYPPAAPQPGSYRGARPSSPGIVPGAPPLLFSSLSSSVVLLFSTSVHLPLHPFPTLLPSIVNSYLSSHHSAAISTGRVFLLPYPGARSPRDVCAASIPLYNDPRRLRAGAKRTGGCDSRERFSSIESVRWFAMR